MCPPKSVSFTTKVWAIANPAEHPFGRRLLHPRARERTEALAFEIGGDAAEHFRQIGPRARRTDAGGRRGRGEARR